MSPKEILRENLFEHAYVLNVVADDRPGIVAAVSSVVDGLGGNIDACSQTVLRGYFTLIMIVSFPEPLDCEKLAETARGPASAKTGFQVVAVPFVPVRRAAQERDIERLVLTAFGSDQPGIIRRLSEYLAGKDINIEDLYWNRTGEDFLLVSQLEVPDDRPINMLQADLEEMGNELGFELRLQHENIFVATNQLRLSRGEQGK